MLRTAAIFALALVAVACGESEDAASETAPATGTSAGLLVQVTDERLVLQPHGGGAPEEYAIRPIDRQSLDLFHLTEHVRQRMPVLVVWEAEDGVRYAERVDDA